MVSKLIRFYRDFLNKESQSLNQAALLLGAFAFLSQILAFLRDRLLAHIFGAGPELDIYYTAFRIPDFIFVTVASVVSVSVLVPFIVEKGGEAKEELKRFIDNVFTFFGWLILLISIIAFFAMPFLSKALFSGLDPVSLEKVITLSRILLLSPIFLGFSNLLGSITQAYNRFFLYALAPLLYNSGIILGILLLGERMGVRGVVWGVVLGAFLHAFIQWPFVYRQGLAPRFSFRIDWQTLRKVASVSIPRTLTLSLSSLILILLVALASQMDSGSVSVLSLSINLQSVPLSLIGVSYSLAAFPTLSRCFQEKNLEAFLEQMRISTKFIFFWTLPLTALLVVERAQVVRVLLGSGEFDWSATRLTAAALALFVISAVFQSILLLFMRGFYSAGKTMKPFVINLFSSIALLLVTYFLVSGFESLNSFREVLTNFLKVENNTSALVLMLPLGFSIGTILNVSWLWISFEREFKGFSKGIFRSVFQISISSLVLGLVSYWGLSIADDWFNINTLPGIFFQGLTAGILGIVSGILVLYLFKNEELASTWASLKGRFWKEPVIATDPEIV